MRHKDDERLLKMILSKDVELVKLAAVQLSRRGVDSVTEFLEEYGKGDSWRELLAEKNTNCPALTEWVIATGLRESHEKFLYILTDEFIMHIGWVISIFHPDKYGGTGPNKDIPIIDFRKNKEYV